MSREREHLLGSRRRPHVVVIVACLTVVMTAVASCTQGHPADDGAIAFTLGDLPDVEPWNPRDGECRILLVGDSLVEATERAQQDAFELLGCESIVDGLASRTLSAGWQCLDSTGASMSITVSAEPEPGNPTCRPSGLELLEQWSDFARSASVTVIALGTNDAGSFTRDGWMRRWQRAIDLTTGPVVFVTAAARPGDRWVQIVDEYNAALREWCRSEPRCTVADWEATAPAHDAASYVDHVHLTRAAGEMRALFIAGAARAVAIPAPPGPTRWRAPVATIPPIPSTTASSTDSRSMPPVPWPPSSTSAPSTSSSPPPTDIPSSVPPTDAVTTTTVPEEEVPTGT